MTATTASATELAANRRDIRPGRILTWTLLFIGGLIMVTPLLFMFSTSLKTSGQSLWPSISGTCFSTRATRVPGSSAPAASAGRGRAASASDRLAASAG